MIIANEIVLSSAKGAPSTNIMFGGATTSYNFILPSAQGNTGQVLSLADNLGHLSWTSLSGAITITTPTINWLGLSIVSSVISYTTTATGTGRVALETNPTFTNSITLLDLAATKPVFTDINRKLVSANTSGTGDVVLTTGPTINGPTFTGTTTTGAISAGAISAGAITATSFNNQTIASSAFTPTIIFSNYNGTNTYSPNSYVGTQYGQSVLFGNQCTITVSVNALMPVMTNATVWIIRGLRYKCISGTSGLDFGAEMVATSFASGLPPIGDSTIGYFPQPFTANLYEAGTSVPFTFAGINQGNYTASGYEIIVYGNFQTWLLGNNTYSGTNPLNNTFFLINNTQCGGQFTLTYLTDGV